MKARALVLAAAATALMSACGGSGSGGDAAAVVATPTASTTAIAAQLPAFSDWVASNGGAPTAAGWTASQGAWRAVWPWPSSSSVVVACSSDGIGYISLADGSRYVLSGEIQSVGEQSTYSGNGVELARTIPQIAAEQKWATEAQSACP